jgi:hypothetical protein
MKPLPILLSLLALGCAAEIDPGAPGGPDDSAAPGLVAADSADRGCQIVLREAARTPSGPGFETSCEGGRCWVVWRGVVDLSPELAAESVAVLYRAGSDPDWRVAEAAPDGTQPYGFVRYRFALDEFTLEEGQSTSSLGDFALEVIPFARLDGGRLFDHNRRPGDFDTYRLDAAGGFAVSDSALFCPAAGVDNVLGFDSPAASYAITARGLEPGGRFVLAYHSARLTSCRGTHNGFRGWGIAPFVRFFAGGAFSESMFIDLPQNPSAPEGWLRTTPIEIPASAERIEVYFLNTNVNNCRAYDSNFGQNFVIPLEQ